jgi:pimeloyl-ACP methyl ester carboxylesterase
MRHADSSYILNDIFVQEWNPSLKKVIVYIHGFPGCADQARLLTSTPLLENFRLIAIDRPGYGKSPFQKKITPIKLAHQLVKLLDDLKIDKVSILSVSGGAPFSMALAHLLKDRAEKLSSIGGVAPLTRKNRRYMNSAQRRAWWFNRIFPSKVSTLIMKRYWDKGIDRVDELLFTTLKDFSEPDQKVFMHPELSPVLAETLRISLSGGPQGIVHDLEIYSRDWGFPLMQIDCPITLWHGSLDDVVHMFYAEEMKTKLSKAELRIIPGEGHYSIAMNYRDQIIQDLL